MSRPGGISKKKVGLRTPMITLGRKVEDLERINGEEVLVAKLLPRLCQILIAVN